MRCRAGAIAHASGDAMILQQQGVYSEHPLVSATFYFNPPSSHVHVT